MQYSSLYLYYNYVIFVCYVIFFFIFFFFNDTATTEIYTLSLHDALPISLFANHYCRGIKVCKKCASIARCRDKKGDRKSTRLNSSHVSISYAVFCLKKKKSNLYATDNIATTNSLVAGHECFRYQDDPRRV